VVGFERLQFEGLQFVVVLQIVLSRASVGVDRVGAWCEEVILQ